MKPDRVRLETLTRPISWPLKRSMSYVLANPRLMQILTTILSRFPFIFKPLLSFAQTHGIVMAPEDAGVEEDKLQSVDELTDSARPIYESLKVAFSTQGKSNL